MSQAQILFRAFSLQIVLDLLPSSRRRKSGATSKAQFEEPKFVIDGRWSTLAAKSSYHLIPLGVTIVVLWFNIKYTYIGSNYPGPSTENFQAGFVLGLQVIAKAYEVTVVASLGAIIFHWVHYELLFNEAGVPLGIFPSGLVFSQVNFLYSQAFMAGLKKGWKTRRWRLFALVMFIGISCVIASLVGPMAAVLLIPQLDWHSAGGSQYWVLGQEQNLYPQRMERNAACDGAELDMYCQAAAYAGIINYTNSMRTIYNYLPSLQMVDEVASRHLRIFGRDGYFRVTHTIVWAPHYTIASLFTRINYDYMLATSVLDRSESSHSPYRNYRWRRDLRWQTTGLAPYVRVACMDSHIRRNSSDPVMFPKLPIPKLQRPEDVPIPIETDMKQLEIWPSRKTDEPAPDTLIKWIDLTPNLLPATTGVFVLDPAYNPDSGLPEDTKIGAACTIDSRWMPAKYVAGGNDVDLRQVRVIPATEDALAEEAFQAFTPPFEPDWQTIKITREWGDSLTSFNVQSSDGGSITALRHLVASARKIDTLALELVLAVLIADGISRSGATDSPSHLELLPNQTWVPEIFKGGNAYTFTPEEGKEYLEQRHQAYIYGLAYSLRESTAARVAVGLLLTYVLIVVVALVWQTVSGISVTVWDSIAEMILLAANSPSIAGTSSNVLGPLMNTGAGIMKLETLGVSVRVVKEDIDRVKMVLDSDGLNFLPVERNLKYR